MVPSSEEQLICLFSMFLEKYDFTKTAYNHKNFGYKQKFFCFTMNLIEE
jgi:hypothetical protein